MGITLYKGVIEDNNDPKKIQRVRVRVYGIHTEKNENSDETFAHVKTADLPWAEVIGDTGMGLVGGIGLSSVLHQGTWVWVILEEGDFNKPVVIGTVTGINSNSPVGKAQSGEGFYDPDEKYPDADRSQETDVNRMARAEGLDDTMHQFINDNLSENEPTSTSDLSEYPNSSVFESGSGHIVEIDDTEGNERVRVIHRSGSYFEFKADGSIVQKGTGPKSHYIELGDVDEYIAGAVNKQIAGAVNKQIAGALNAIIGGNATIDTDGNVTINIGGALTVTASGAVGIEGGPSVDIVGGVINLN